MNSALSTQLLFILCCSSLAASNGTALKDYPIVPVDFTKTTFSEGFWKYRLDVNQQVTLPENFKKSEETGRIRNFAKAGKLMDGKHEGIFFNDSDVFKIVEGAAYTLALNYDEELDTYLDKLIELFAAAQEDDGYLYTARTIVPVKDPKAIGKKRWENIRHGHELYNVGHMYEAAVAHFQITGKRNFLDVAIKNADLICRVFGPGKKYATPGHQEIEIGLIKLYRVTENKDYLDMARFFIEQRGNDENRELLGDYCQDHKPLVEQSEAVGHSVRAEYFYAGAADVAALTDNKKYVAALDRIWGNMVGKKMYLTGGIGARHQGEQFGADYELPNESAYAETCAAISNILWNHRMFLLKGDSKYIDVLERSLYNGFLSGISLTGDTFFYVNPLSSDGYKRFNHGACIRKPWFDCSCCPTNIVRLLPSLPGYVYAVRNNTVYVNLYIAGKSSFAIDQTTLSLEQHTKYPWDGNIRITVSPEKNSKFELYLRIPGWAMGNPVPGDLYRYTDKNTEEIQLQINGEDVPASVTQNGYVCLRRIWKQGDTVTLELPMPIRYVSSHEAIENNKNRIAIERGPLVYCAEGIDNNGHVENKFISKDISWKKQEQEILPGAAVIALTGAGKAVYRDAANQPERIEEEDVTLIPYYSWAHRGAGEMQVWIADNAETAQVIPQKTLASTAHISASHTGKNEAPAALNDMQEPKSSKDSEIDRFTWWPHKGTQEWVQYDFDKEVTVGGMDIYWFDDAPHGECRAPSKWELLYLQGKNWKPVNAVSQYTTTLNQYNSVTFSPISTRALRLDVQLQEKYSCGILEWKISEDN
ncbi:MAG: glycoside hydrolase family 127 protein [Candidatus Hydrogenedentes bacterium]|nr:glycoside hydrolase family 127 protein [Candidatus Hydrogenedentota bacterium]